MSHSDSWLAGSRDGAATEPRATDDMQAGGAPSPGGAGVSAAAPQRVARQLPRYPTPQAVREVLPKFANPYGDMPPWGQGPDPQKVYRPDGYDYLAKKFPDLAYFETCTVDETPMPPASPDL